MQTNNLNKIKDFINAEQYRQENEICLIASENYMSKDVLNACGSVLINKYSEGNVPDENGKYRRYYSGCEYIDEIEKIAIEEAKELFNCKYANVQPNSGCQANQAVYMALCKPNDTIYAMDINSGGHISHSLSIGLAGTFYNVKTYGLTNEGYINYDEIEENIYKYKPRLLICGASAYPRMIDFKRFRDIVDTYNAANEAYKCYLMADIAHIAGLVATGYHPSPFPYCDVVTSTVQKTLRSGRGGIILTNDEELAKKIDKAVFPRLQGGPLNNMIAGKAIGFNEALQPEFTNYISQVLKNVRAMVDVFRERGVKMISGGSENHLILLDLRDKKISGKELENALESVGIITNKNAIQNDTRPKDECSGLRIGTACITTRGADEKDSAWIAHQICHIIDILTDEYDYSDIQILDDAGLMTGGKTPKETVLFYIKEQVKFWCKDHPIYAK